MNIGSVSLANLFLAVVIIIRIIVLQLQPRVIKFRANIYLIMIIFGIYEGLKIKNFHITIGFIWFVILSLISTLLFGYLRAISYQLWINDQQLIMRQGTWLTLTLWIIGITVHFFIDRLWAQSSIVILVYIGLTLLIQRGIVWYLAGQRFPEEIKITYNTQNQHRRTRHERRHHRHDDY